MGGFVFNGSFFVSGDPLILMVPLLMELANCLFDNGRKIPKYEPGSRIGRKLHETCVNHKLANYLACGLELLKVEKLVREKLYVDIEFNRNGTNPKERGTHKIRPDIIVHNRKHDHLKFNLLVVECKHRAALDYNPLDWGRVAFFMTDPMYQYRFGLQVTYHSGQVVARLRFRCEAGQLKDEEV